MKKNCIYLLCAAATQLLTAGICSAQSATLALKAPAAAVVVDGTAQEWGDSLSYYNPEKKIHYTIANDKDNIYLVVKTNDPMQESNILNSGITFSVDTKGRKKSAYSVTFPQTNGTPVRMGKSVEDKALVARFTKLRKIGVSGFKDVSEDEINTTNDYGIKVAMDYNEKGYLVYEEQIPLTLFHAGDLIKNDWSFNLKINGVEGNAGGGAVTATDLAPSSIGRNSPMGGNAGAGRNSRGGSFKMDTGDNFKGGQSSPEIDFWGKFSLSKPQ